MSRQVNISVSYASRSQDTINCEPLIDIATSLQLYLLPFVWPFMSFQFVTRAYADADYID